MQLTNPASVHCGEVGGELRIESLGNSGEVGVCWFEDGRQCEEWALLRGECPVGGRRVTGLLLLLLVLLVTSLGALLQVYEIRVVLT